MLKLINDIYGWFLAISLSVIALIAVFVLVAAACVSLLLMW